LPRVVYYVMVTAFVYIAVGYYLGRRLMYAPFPTSSSLDSRETRTQSQQLDDVIAARDEPKDDDLSISVAAAEETPQQTFVPQEDLPPQWLDILDGASECKSIVEASVQVLRLEVGKYRERLVNIDGDVRQCLRAPNPAKLQAAVTQLRAVNSEWMDRQAEAASYLMERKKSLGELAPLGDTLDQVLQSQAEQIETTCSNIDMFNFQASPMIGARRLVIEMRKLVDLAHTLRDCMQELLLTVMAREGRLDSTDKALQTDNLTGLKNRTGIEAFMRKWWRDDGRRIRQISVAMFDLDRFSPITERWGARVTDKLLASIARIVDDMLRKYSGLDWCGRFAGQRFFVFWADTGPHGATSVVERIRQTIAETHFELPQGTIEVTFSAAVTEVLPEDTTKSLFTRLNKTLREAKLAGRNCTYLFDGTAPKQVEPPQFDVRGKVAKLEA
jgi:diguanylate cyclase (GGDEF)-like protein